MSLWPDTDERSALARRATTSIRFTTPQAHYLGLCGAKTVNAVAELGVFSAISQRSRTTVTIGAGCRGVGSTLPRVDVMAANTGYGGDNAAGQGTGAGT